MFRYVATILFGTLLSAPLVASGRQQALTQERWSRGGTEPRARNDV